MIGPHKEMYRYDTHSSIYGKSYPFLQSYPIVRRTRACWVIDFYGKEKFIIDGVHGKRFAYPTPQLALHSYIKRKIRRIAILASQHDTEKDALDSAKSMRESGDIEFKETYFQSPSNSIGFPNVSQKS